jgi:hypothetical protein
MSRRWVRALSWYAIVASAFVMLDGLLFRGLAPVQIATMAVLLGLGIFFLIRTNTP